MDAILAMPNGHSLFVKDNGRGGRTYWSHEQEGGVLVWDTSLVSESTLTYALAMEKGQQALKEKIR